MLHIRIIVKKVIKHCSAFQRLPKIGLLRQVWQPMHQESFSATEIDYFGPS